MTQNFCSQPLSWTICAALCVSWSLSHPSHQMPDKGETLARFPVAHSLEDYNLPWCGRRRRRNSLVCSADQKAC